MDTFLVKSGQKSSKLGSEGVHLLERVGQTAEKGPFWHFGSKNEVEQASVWQSFRPGEKGAQFHTVSS